MLCEAEADVVGPAATANGADAARVASRLDIFGVIDRQSIDGLVLIACLKWGENAAADVLRRHEVEQDWFEGRKRDVGVVVRALKRSARGGPWCHAWSQELDARTQGRHGQPVSEQPKRHLADGRHRPRFQWKRPTREAHIQVRPWYSSAHDV